MKTKMFLTVVALFYGLVGQAQSWQWGKSGGTSDSFYPLYEAVRSTCTDRYGNVYITSEVGTTNSQVNGVPKQSYNSGFGLTDAVIASFSCDGAYRWSKIIGGGYNENVNRLATDAEGNLYAIGNVTPSNNAQSVVHFDADVQLPYAPVNQNVNKQALYLIKYDRFGNYKWLRMPQPADVNVTVSITYSNATDLEVDALGNSYWLCHLPVGSYADGAFTVTTPGYCILKYDAEGVFLGGVALAAQQTNPKELIGMARDPVSGVIYLGREIFQDAFTDPVYINGAVVTKGKFIAAFNSDGTFLWLRESETKNVNHLNDSYAITVDEDHNVYFASSTSEYLDENNVLQIDSFGGAPLPDAVYTVSPCPFIAKMDAQGNNLWITSGTVSSPSDMVINGDEVAISGKVGMMQWQNLSYTAPNSGLHPYIARFNKNTGSILALHALNSTSGSDIGVSLATDTKGNYYMGGSFGSAMTVGATTLYNSGGTEDFFIAKFGSTDCNFLATAAPELKDFRVFPNPVQSELFVSGFEQSHYIVYDVLGAQVLSGIVLAEGSIAVGGLAVGVYVLRLENAAGAVKVVKVLRE